MDKLFYFPRLLAAECERIEKIFNGHNRFMVDPDGDLDDLLKQLIYSLVLLKPSQVSRFGRERSENEISALARYVCTNSLNVKCDNIYTLLNDYASPSDWETIFSIWQNYLNNQEALVFLKNGIENNSKFQEYLSSKGIDKTNLFWLNHNDKVDAICSKCKNTDTIEEYKTVLNKTGLIDDTILMKTCLAKFFLNCSAKAYKRIGENDIYDAFTKLSLEEKFDLIVNFVGVFTIQELQEYSKIYNAFESLNAKNRALFKERLQSANLWEKYDRWAKLMIIKIGFIGNEDPYRTAFWLQYGDTATSTELMWFSKGSGKVIVITFDNYVITEFGGRAEGKAYVFTRELFKEYRSKIRYLSMYGFKSEVNSDSRVLEAMAHRPGNGGWRSEFRYRLRRYGINPSEN